MDFLNIKILSYSLLIGIITSPLTYTIQCVPNNMCSFREAIESYPINLYHFLRCLIQYECRNDDGTYFNDEDKQNCSLGLICLILFLMTNFIFYRCSMKLVELKPKLMSASLSIATSLSFLSLFLYHIDLNLSFHMNPLFDLIGLTFIIVGGLLCANQEVFYIIYVFIYYVYSIQYYIQKVMNIHLTK